MAVQGIVVAGHERTAQAAKAILQAGGNAFDAAIAAFFTACATEPVLASLGGGGFLLARPVDGPAKIFDFFVHTPQVRCPDADIDFRPIVADFGATQQEFHIGFGSIATPGLVRGMFEVHRQLGSMPLTEIVLPAVEAAKYGVRVNFFQAYILSIVAPIFSSSEESKQAYGGSADTGLAGEGDLLRNEQLAETIEILALEGDDLFYRGEIAQLIAEQCQASGGHLTSKDLQDYRVQVRDPLEVPYRNGRLFTNPPPASGGLLIGFGLRMLADVITAGTTFGSKQHLAGLARVMGLTNRARMEFLSQSEAHNLDATALLDDDYLKRYREEIAGRPAALRGTTHIGVIDKNGNVASLSVSNGEGCGALIPGTGIMLNNMLGEQDLNPAGFHRWTPNERMTSMMSPTLLVDGKGRLIATGSGGS
ncbi:MAG: gamma-glutamyltransferase, partial [Gammaproteobacteria bacterium]